MYPLAETGLEKMNDEQSSQNEYRYIHNFKASQEKKPGTFSVTPNEATIVQHCEVKSKPKFRLKCFKHGFTTPSYKQPQVDHYVELSKMKIMQIVNKAAGTKRITQDKGNFKYMCMFLVL